MAVNTENVKLGVCTVTFGGIDLGATKGGVEVTLDTNTYEVKIDQFGETPVKAIVTGRSAKVKVPMAETDLDKLAAVLPGITKRAISTVTKGLKIDIGINTDLLASAKELKLHPYGVPTNETDEDFGLFNAGASASLSFSYQTNQERVYEVEFTGYPSEPYGGALGWMGLKWDFAAVYWGRTNGTTQLTEATLEALAGTADRGTRKGVRSFLADAVNTTIRLCWPADFDTGFDPATSVINQATGLPLVFTAETAVTVVDTNGVSRSYKSYKSSNTVTGAVTLEIN